MVLRDQLFSLGTAVMCVCAAERLYFGVKSDTRRSIIPFRSLARAK